MFIALQQSVRDSRATRRLKYLLNVKTHIVIGSLSLLWLWAVDNASDGDLSATTAPELADIMEWEGDATKLQDALVESGYLDVNYQITNWHELFGKIMESREAHAISQARYRASRDYHVTITSPSRDPLPYPITPYPITPEPITPEPIKSENIVPSEGNKPKPPTKKNYGEFQNVHLTDTEYQKLKDRFDGKREDMIENLSCALKSNPSYDKKYTDHYSTLLSWARMDTKKENASGFNRRNIQGQPHITTDEDRRQSLENAKF